MKSSTRDLLRLLRPRQWVKNFAVFAAVLFSGQLFNLEILEKVLAGFIVFCALSSAIYVINDLFDIEKDRLHPFKRFRPIASGQVTVQQATWLALALGICALIVSYLISPAFFAIALVYLILHVTYSAFWKHIEIIDILTLAAGYMLRVYAGEILSTYHISAWLFLTTISVSLFLAIGKRRSELTLLSHHPEARGTIIITRKTLSKYSEKLLDVYLSIFATSTFISYSLFTFLENPKGVQFGNDFFPADVVGTVLQRKWLMVTIVPVVYGLMRYLQRVYEKHEGESPERLLFSDKALLIDVLIYTFLVIFVIYFLQS